MDSPSNWQPRLDGVRAAEREGRWAEACEQAEALSQEALRCHDPALALEAGIISARLRANGGELPAARALLEQLLAAPGLSSMSAGVADAWVLQSGVLASLGDGAAAAQAIQQVTRCLAEAPLDASQRQRAYNGLSVAYYQLGLTAMACRLARESLRLQPPSAEDTAGQMRWLNLAMLLTVMHDESAHLPDGEPGRAGGLPSGTEPESGEGWLTLACEQLDGAVAQVPHMPPWLQVFHRVLQAGVLRRQGQAEAAAAELREALAHPAPRPDSLTRYARQELAQALAQHGSTRDEAQVLAEGLLREAREAPGAGTSMWQIENVAQLAELAGRPDEALRAQQRGMALLRRNAVALLEAQQDGVSSRVDAQTQRLLNADLEQRNRDLARRVQDVTHAARYDALTGVLNRRGLEQAFGRAQGRDGFAVLLADLDEFKLINDERSHLVGDAVLRRVGALLQEHLREPDAVGRWGGEEFLLVLHGCDAEQAQTIAERLRDRVASAPWDELGAGLTVTVSIGWTLAGPAEAMEAVVARADAGLYRAKGQGRNRVCPG